MDSVSGINDSSERYNLMTGMEVKMASMIQDGLEYEVDMVSGGKLDWFQGVDCHLRNPKIPGWVRDAQLKVRVDQYKDFLFEVYANVGTKTLSPDGRDYLKGTSDYTFYLFDETDELYVIDTRKMKAIVDAFLQGRSMKELFSWRKNMEDFYEGVEIQYKQAKLKSNPHTKLFAFIPRSFGDQIILPS